MSTKTTNTKATKDQTTDRLPKASGSSLSTREETQISEELGPIGTPSDYILFDCFQMFHTVDSKELFSESLVYQSADVIHLCAITPRRIAKAVREKKQIVIILPDPEYLDFIVDKTLASCLQWLDFKPGSNNCLSGKIVLPTLSLSSRPLTRYKLANPDVSEIRKYFSFVDATRADIYHHVILALNSFLDYHHLLNNLPTNYPIRICQFGHDGDDQITAKDEAVKGLPQVLDVLSELDTLMDKTIECALELVVQQAALNSTLPSKTEQSSSLSVDSDVTRDAPASAGPAVLRESNLASEDVTGANDKGVVVLNRHGDVTAASPQERGVVLKVTDANDVTGAASKRHVVVLDGKEYGLLSRKARRKKSKEANKAWKKKGGSHD